MSYLELVAIVVHDYDPAIRFFVDVLGFTLVEDSPSTTTDGRPKRWVVVRLPNAQTGLLLARADGARQVEVVGNQHAGRVGFFLRVDDFNRQYERMVDAGVEFVRPPRMEVYGQVAVFFGYRRQSLGLARSVSEQPANMTQALDGSILSPDLLPQPRANPALPDAPAAEALPCWSDPR